MKKIELKELLAIPPAYGANHAAVPYEPGVTHRYVRITDVDENGRLIPEKRVGIPKEAGDPYLTKKGDLLLARSGATVGKSFFVDEDDIYSHAGYLIRFRFDERKVIREYIRQYFNSPNYWSWVSSSIRAGAQPNINAAEYSGLIVPLPALPEQKKIAEILGACDEAIEAQERLIAQKQQRKKGLMQMLLTGQVRFPEFVGSQGKSEYRFFDYPNDWKLQDIEDFAVQISRRNSFGDLPVLSCTKHDGLVDSLKYFKKQVFAEDTSGYKVVERGEFAYATNHLEEGSIGYQDFYDQALISPIYCVFKTNDSIDDRWLYALLKTEMFRHVFEVNTNASVNRRGSVRWNVFRKIKVAVPSVEEQRIVADFIQSLSEEIALQQSKLDQLKQQKKGLMQQLLTGKVRVKV